MSTRRRSSPQAIGRVTRGTTNPNRLRRIDRYIASLSNIRTAENPVVVDLGYGASPITAVELLSRLRKINSKVTVVGVEIERDRVDRGLEIAHDHLLFTHGGFEVPLPAPTGDRADVIRAFNVLRQYEESEVQNAWSMMQSRLTDDGLLVEGTCDEIGRLACWVTLNRNVPLSLTVSLRLLGLAAPSKVAERLPKVLIHRNLPGEPIHEFLKQLDLAWASNAGLSAFSPVQRWVSTCKKMLVDGWPIIGDQKRWRLGEITVDWKAVAPK
ncbi:MAG: class I SAM-dependent methyltransferase [Rhodoluna sp.]